MVDETVQPLKPEKIKSDLVVLFFSTPDAIRGYELADQLRNRGIQVVIGGLHATFMKEEAAQHADAIITGEYENIWETLLQDAESKQLKPLYVGTPADLSTVNSYPKHLITAKQYDGMWSVLVSRGCRHKCSFCLVPEMLGNMRYRPVEQVVEEIRQWIPIGLNCTPIT